MNTFSSKHSMSITAALAVLFLSACANIGNTSTDSDETTASASITATLAQAASYSASESPCVIEVDASTKTLTIAGLSSGKEIYLAKNNPTAEVVSEEYSRYLTAYSGLSVNKRTSAPSRSLLSLADESAAEDGEPHWHCLIPDDSAVTVSADSARAALSATSSVTQLSGTVGETKDIYVDTSVTSDGDLAGYKQKDATLRAVGTYCYVWIIDDYYSETASGSKVNEAVAETIAAQFDAVYPLVRNVFGEECDYLLSSVACLEMSSYSSTGTKVNIVLYDIGADYNSGEETGIAGYFYSKDYYSAASYSNCGKYFYVDSAYANEDINSIYSTLAHEFQHMILFGTKYIAKGVAPSTAYNEMLSMLCEDMLEVYFEDHLSGFTADASPISRLPLFNKLYYLSGLEYRTDESAYTLCSYATNYAFGAWLLRSYGGIPLLKEIASNNSADISSILLAVNAVNDSSSLSITDLLLSYSEACIFNNEGSGFNNAVSALTSDSDLYYADASYGYPLVAIDLWNLALQIPSTAASAKNSAYYRYNGPYLLAANEYAEVRPYGMLLHDLGTATSDTVSLTFSTNSTANLKMYVIIE